MILSMLQKNMQKKLLETLYRDLHHAIIAAWISGLILLYGLWPMTEHAVLSGWFLALSLELMVSLCVLRRYRREGERHPPHYWLGITRRLTLFFALIWIMGVFLLFPDHAPLYQSFFIITIAGVTAGGTSTLSSDRVSALILNIGILLALTLRLLTEEAPIYRLEALLVTIYMIMMVFIVLRLHHGKIALLTEWQRTRQNASRLAKSRERLQFLFDSVPAGIFYYDRTMNVIESNTLFGKLIFGRKGRIDLSTSNLLLPEALRTVLRKALDASGREVEEEIRIVHGNQTRWLRIKAKSIAGEERGDGVAIVMDVTEEKKCMDRIRYQAEHDPLTRLPNRHYFVKKIATRLRRLNPQSESLGILFVDLDNFKPINDRYGHLLGDKVLQAVARRLRHHFRRRDLVARYGGDEFVILIGKLPPTEPKARDVLLSIAEHLLKHFDRPFSLDGREYTIHLSIGVTLTHDPSHDPEALIERADRAMYQVKSLGKHRVICLDETGRLYPGRERRVPILLRSEPFSSRPRKQSLPIPYELADNHQ